MVAAEKKRRDKGEGSVYQRKDGTWAAQYIPDGSTKPKYLYGKTENEVKKKLREFKKEVAKNGYTEIQKITVKEYMDKWLYTVKKNKLKPTSFDRDEFTLNNQVYPYIGDMQIGALTHDDIQRLLNTLVDNGFAYSTIKKAHDVINACFKLGIIKEEIAKNPCVGVSLPINKKVEKSNIKFFNERQVEQICAMSTAKYNNGKLIYRLGHAIVVLVYTGLRIGELLALTWDDIDYDERIIRVNKSTVRIRNRDENITTTKYILLEQESLKTDSGARIVDLNNKAIAALQAIQEFNGKHKYVMSCENGEIILQRNVHRMLEKILLKCELQPCGVHTLRHTYASMLFRRGVDVKIVSAQLGHADVSITYNTYVHLIKEQKRQAVRLLDE